MGLRKVGGWDGMGWRLGLGTEEGGEEPRKVGANCGSLQRARGRSLMNHPDFRYRGTSDHPRAVCISYQRPRR